MSCAVTKLTRVALMLNVAHSIPTFTTRITKQYRAEQLEVRPFPTPISAIYLCTSFSRFFSSLSLFSHDLYQSAMIQSSLFIFKVLILLFSIRVDAQSTQPLVNHQILSSNITSSGQQHFYFNPSTSAGLTKRGLLTLTTTDNDHVPWTKRDPTTTFYLTLTSCSQPSPPPNYQGEIPSIDLYLSTVSSNTLPGPTHHQNNNTVDDTLPGRISWQGNNVPELWIGVAAPTLTAAWTGQWTYELAISTQRKSFYYYYFLWKLERMSFS